MRSLRLFRNIGLSVQRINHFSSFSGAATFDSITQTIYAGNFKDIKSAIDQIDLTSEEYIDLLHIAVAATTSNPDDTRSLDYILSKKIDINRQFSKVPGFNPTPALIAAMHGCSKTLEVLLSHGANANVACEIKNDVFHRHIVPLHQAAVQGHEKMVELLIKHHAVVDNKSAAGETPLLHACWKGHLGVMNLLLDNGADPHAQSVYGHFSISGTTPMDFIQENKALLDSYNSRSSTPTRSR